MEYISIIVSDIWNDSIAPNKPNVDAKSNAVADNKAMSRIENCPSCTEFRTSIHFSCATELITDMFFAVNMLLRDFIIAVVLRGVVSVMFIYHVAEVILVTMVQTFQCCNIETNKDFAERTYQMSMDQTLLRNSPGLSRYSEGVRSVKIT